MVLIAATEAIPLKRTSVMHLGVGLVLAVASAGCSRGASRQAQSSSQGTAPPTAQQSGSVEAPGTQEQGAAPSPCCGPTGSDAGPAPSGPRTQISSEHYTIDVQLAPPSAVPGESTMTVEIRGKNGFHVNERAPVGLDLTTTNATARAEWRAADVSQRTQEVVAFRVPVQVTGAGAVVRGTARAVVCRTGEEGICEFVTRPFAVSLPQ